MSLGAGKRDGEVNNQRTPSWLVCFGPGDYHAFTPSCTTHIVNEFWNRGYRIIWINPVPIGIPNPFRSGGRRRILNRLMSYSRPLRRVRPRFYTFSPIQILGATSLNEDGWSRRMLRLQICAVLRHLKARDALLWIETPTALYAKDLVGGPVIYQLSDKYELSRYASAETKAMLATQSDELVRSSDIVLCTSKTLWREVREVRRDAVYLAHAVDTKLFRRSRSIPPEDIRELSRPVIGYFGTLSSSNNQSLLRECAIRHPEWSIVLIGRITGGDWSSLQRMPNVHFLGFKPLDLIPRYGECFDVAVMDWTVDSWMYYAHPLKAREYLALGLPVVSVPIPEIVECYGEHVYLAEEADEFVCQVERALREDSPSARINRHEWATRHTWVKYVDEVFEHFIRRGSDGKGRRFLKFSNERAIV